jgi:hypothetical protein
MSPLFDPQRAQINAVRTAREETEQQILANQTQVHNLEIQRAQRARAGAPAAELAALDQQITAAQQARQDLHGTVQGLNQQISQVVNGLLLQVPPEQLFAGLDGAIPLALLPVRLETRFFQTAAGGELRLRIYPDQLHLDSHIPELLPSEADLGRWYWGFRWAGDEAQTQLAWNELVKRLKAPRAAWVVRQLTPTNPPGVGDAPLFSEPPLRASGVNPSPRATLLPDRWCAVGLRRTGSEYQSVFKNGRVWGSSVPDTLNVSTSFDALSEISDNPDEHPLDAGLRWLTDYEAARQVGMAITITDADLVPGARLQDGLDLLVVLGMDWTLAPDQGAAALAQLLHDHQFSDGLGFVPQGTPTNNTNDARSGFSSDPATQAAGLNPVQPPALDPIHSAGARLQHGLGLPEGTAADLNLAPQAALREARLSSLMVDALWESTIGYYLRELLSPLLTDTAVDLLRDHAAKFLQPFGPFSALRVAKQPYGLLPVLPRHSYKPNQPAGLEERLNRVLTVLRWYWENATALVPQMGRHDNPDDDLLALLRRTPSVSNGQARFMAGPELYANAQKGSGYDRFVNLQTDLLRSLVLPQLASVAGPFFPQTRLAQMRASPIERKLSTPWVQGGTLQPGGPLIPNYVADIAQQVLEGGAGQAALNQSTDSPRLLEALLALAGLREMHYAEGKTLNTHLVNVHLLDGPIEHFPLATHTLVGIFSDQENPPQANMVKVETAQQLANLVIPQLTGARKLTDFVSDAIRLAGGPEKPELCNLATFQAALTELANFSALELEQAFRGVLDCYAYRLDAWLTSQAARRLAAVRDQRPNGVHVGGYGWVENLRRDTLPDSLGYIHTPSLGHAVTAAVMRAGYVNNRGAQDINTPVNPLDPKAALSIDLSSERVRLAMTLLEGVSQGQPLAALLGYRLERNLRERDILLTQFIMPLRKLAPYHPAAPDTTSGPAESIAARNVVDGIALLSQWRAGPEQVLNGITAPTPDAGQREALRQEIGQLAGMFDAVSDLLVSEAVYQTVNGNYERAGAALSALDRQTRPPEPDVIRTPRTGMLFQQRVAVIQPAGDLPPAWAGFPSDARAQAEPRLNAWIAARLGDPARVRLAARLLQTQPDGSETVLQDLETGLAQLGLSPLSLVLTCVSTNPQTLSDLELRLVKVCADQAAAPTPDLKLELLEEPPAGAPEGTVGYGRLRALLQLLHPLVTRHRGADARDFAPPELVDGPACDLDELRGRLAGAKTALAAAITALEGATAAIDPDALRAALLQASDAGALGAVPNELLSDGEAAQVLLKQALSVLAALKSTQKRLQDLEDGFAPTVTGSDLETTTLQHLVTGLRFILGESFPVLPLFRLVNPDEFSASRADQAALLGGDEFAPLTWLQQMGPVRPETDALVAVLSAADLLDTPVPAEEFSVVQFPHVPGQRWAALELPGQGAEPHLALLLLGQFDPTAPLAALYCDGWSEEIPSSRETTGVTFHYDVPAARPPQAVLLAVPPDLADLTWNIDRLLDSVLETIELARIRLVGPREIPALGGGLLPALFLPEDETKQNPAAGTRFWMIKDGYVQGKEYHLVAE